MEFTEIVSNLPESTFNAIAYSVIGVWVVLVVAVMFWILSKSND